ncbi:hypothetical protein V5O48_007117 [Marasmius crinis-equi]|uniref:Uncharacterized protein n=1 Tax=Marasmius crinis-equi TaxID=585013 RepID=A0ABR3FIC8_9AGAR
MSGYEVTGSPWDLDAVLSAMSTITTVAPEPALRPCEPKIYDNNEIEVVFRGQQTAERYYEVLIDSNPSQKFQSRQGLYRASDDMEHKKHSAKGLRTGPYEIFRAKEVYQHHCLQLHKRLGDPAHQKLREDAAKQAIQVADSARARLLQQELRILFPGMINDGEPLPSLIGNPNFLKSSMMHEERLGGEFVKFPMNAEFRSSESLGSWALFVVSEEGIEKYSSLQPATVAAKRKVATGPVAIVFTPWAVNAQKVFGMLTGRFSRQEEDAALADADDDDAASVSSLSSREISALDGIPCTMPQEQGPSSTSSNTAASPPEPAPGTISTPSPEPPREERAAADKPLPPNATAPVEQNPLQNAPSASGPPKAKRRRGNPGAFTDTQRDYFESHYDEFLSHPRKDKAKFWDSFFPTYFELFPVEDFPPPPVAKALGNLSEADRAALGNKELKARKRSEKRRELDEYGRMKDSIKNWYQQRQKKGSNSVQPFLRRIALVQKDPPPRKRQLRQFLITHPEYKDKVVARSTETSARNRLDRRLEAASDMIAEMPQEEKARVIQERDKLHQNAKAVWVEKNKGNGLPQVDEEERVSARESLPAFIQPLLEVVQDMTGYLVFFQAGVDTGDSDPRSRFESISVSTFGTDFNAWLKAVKEHAPSLSSSPQEDSQEPAATLQQEGASSGAATSGAGQKGSRNNSKKTTRKQRNNDGVEEEEEEDSPVLDDDSDESDGSDVDQLNDDAGDGEGGGDGEGEDDSEGEAEPRKRRGVPYSAYELQRMENIERNKQLLAKLGLQGASSFIGGPKPSTTPLLDDTERTGVDAEPEKPAERPRPRPQRVLHSSVQKNNGPAEPSPDVDTPTLTSTSITAVRSPLAPQSPPAPPPPASPEQTRSHSQPLPHLSPAELPSASRPLSPPQPPQSQPSSPRSSPSSSPAQAPGSLHPLVAQSDQTPAPSASSLLPPAPPSNPAKDGGSNTKEGQNVAMEIDEPRVAVKRAYGELTIPIPTATECFDPIGSNSNLCRSYGPYLLSKPPNLPDVQRPAIWPALVYKWVELQEKWEHDGAPDAVFTTVKRIPAMKAWFNNGRVDRSSGLVTQKGVVLEKIRNEWWIWWDYVNPDWRPRLDGMVLPGDDGDWEDIVSPGKDGIVLFLVGLRWWCDCGGPEDPAGCWHEAAKSLFFTMESLLKRISP